MLVYPHEPFRQLFGSGLLHIIKNRVCSMSTAVILRPSLLSSLAETPVGLSRDVQ